MTLKNSITQAHIDDLLARSTVSSSIMGIKSTVVCVTLPNGFELIESSGCVDPENYDHTLGVKICLERIKNRLWTMEGYRLSDHLAHRVEKIAKTCHEVNRASCAAFGDWSQLAWEDAPQWQRDSAITGVRFHIANPDATPEQSHEKWLETKRADGWTYGPVKNAERKLHPCFKPYFELPVEQQVKDYLFRATVHALA